MLVPFGGGNRQRQGIVVRTDTAEDTARLKPIAQVLEREPLLDGEMMDLALWLKERTFCTVFDAVRAMLPTGLYMRLRPMLRLAPKAEDRLEEMTPEERQIVSFLAKCPAAGVEQETLLKKLGLNPDAPGLLRLLEWGPCSGRRTLSARWGTPPSAWRAWPWRGGAGRGAERLHR